MKVLISVLNYNNFLSTKKCIYSILSFPKKNTEIYIVDNNSSDNSYLDLKREFPELKIKKSKVNGGYASGHKNSVNYAIKNKFDFIWILNNDLTVRKHTLESLLAAVTSHGLGLYGSITLKSESPDIINFGGGLNDGISKPFNYNSFENYSLENYLKVTKLRPVQTIEGSSFLIPTEIIIKHGFMREDFFMYGEETDYCYRLKKLNINSYIVPKSVVVHKGGEGLRNNKGLESYYRRRNMLYFEKEHYNISIIKNINKRVGVFNFVKYFIKHLIYNLEKDTQYYLNIAFLHCIFKIKGKYK